jgi:hypothetical protein
MTMVPDPCDALVSAHTAVSGLHDRVSDFVSDLLDLLTEQCPHNQDLLRRVVTLRTQAAELNGQAEDALADLKLAIEALAPSEGVL